jgi:hypothetical protein
MTTGSSRSSACAVTVIFATVLAAGCSGKAEVSGMVKFKGEPLPSGRIIFLSEVNQKTFSGLIKDGAYTVSGVTPGPVKVKIETTPALKLDPEEAKAKGIKLSKRPEEKHVKIPGHYGDFKKSGLDFEVTSGSQTHNFDLKPDKR